MAKKKIPESKIHYPWVWPRKQDKMTSCCVCFNDLAFLKSKAHPLIFPSWPFHSSQSFSLWPQHVVTAASRPLPMVDFLWSGKQSVLIHNFLQGLVQDPPPLKSLSSAALAHVVPPVLRPLQHMHSKLYILAAHPSVILPIILCFQIASPNKTASTSLADSGLCISWLSLSVQHEARSTCWVKKKITRNFPPAREDSTFRNCPNCSNPNIKQN